MKYYAPQHKQLTPDLVRSSLDNLDKSNRWVQVGDNLPWPDIEKEYNSKLDNKEKGAGNKPARMIVGAMIVKSCSLSSSASLRNAVGQAEQDAKDK